MKTLNLTPEAAELLHTLLTVHRDELSYMFRQSFSPEAVGIHGRYTDNTDLRTMEELRLTKELIKELEEAK